MCLTTLDCGSLPATKTHANRRWMFVGTADLNRPGLGTATVIQGKKEVESYFVDVEDAGAGHHLVLLAKQSGDGDVYGVTCDRAGKPLRCTCKGFNCTKHCKHLDLVTALVAADILPLVGVLPAVLEPTRCRLCGEPLTELGTAHFACETEAAHYASQQEPAVTASWRPTCSADLQGGF